MFSESSRKKICNGCLGDTPLIWSRGVAFGAGRDKLHFFYFIIPNLLLSVEILQHYHMYV